MNNINRIYHKKYIEFLQHLKKHYLTSFSTMTTKSTTKAPTISQQPVTQPASLTTSVSSQSAYIPTTATTTTLVTIKAADRLSGAMVQRWECILMAFWPYPLFTCRNTLKIHPYVHITCIHVAAYMGGAPLHLLYIIHVLF